MKIFAIKENKIETKGKQPIFFLFSFFFFLFLKFYFNSISNNPNAIEMEY